MDNDLMRYWILLLSACLLVVTVAVLWGGRDGSEPKVITIRELHNGRRVTFNQTLNGKYRRQILASYPLRPVNNLNWSPDDNSMIIINFDGNVYRYGFYSGRLESVDCPLCSFAGTSIHWSEDGSDFFMIASTELRIFHDDTWYRYSNGDVVIGDAHWSGDRIIFADYTSRITSVNTSGRDRATVYTGYNTMISVHDDSFYTFDQARLYRVSLVGQYAQPLVRFGPLIHNYTTPAISPDEQLASFVGEDHFPYLVDINSGDTSRLAARPICEVRCEFQWSPDSKDLLILNEERMTGAANWFHVEVTSRTINQLTNSGRAFDAAWVPFSALSWHPLWLAVAALVLVATTGLRKMI